VYVDDVADAALVAMKHFENAEIVNVGLGYDVTIRELAAHIANVVGYRGTIVFDPKKPDGTPQKLLDVSRLAALGWRAKVSIGDGIERTYRWYVEHVAKP
jgi:GDP-L-fucose synthase